MNTNFFVFVAMFVNVFLAVLFPMQLFGEDPLGIDSIRSTNFDGSGYFSTKVREDFQDTGFFTSSGGASSQDKVFEQYLEAGEDGSQVTLFGDEGFGFLDWFRVGWNILKSIFVFAFAFIILLFALPAPFNLLVGVPLGLGYIYSLGRLILNR